MNLSLDSGLENAPIDPLASHFATPAAPFSQSMKLSSLLPLCLGLALVSTKVAVGHPVPDIPVRSFFEADGTARLEVEVDVRCFSKDPVMEPYLQHWVLKEMTEEERKEKLGKASAFVEKSIAFFIEPEGRVKPDFEWHFTSHRGEDLDAIDDPVMITGIWKTKITKPDAGIYHIEALPEGTLSILFLNHINDEAVERFQVLFPGEKSYRLELASIGKSSSPPAEEATTGKKK